MSKKKDNKKSCNNAKRIHQHGITPKNTLEHKKKQIARPERQNNEEVAPRILSKKQKSEHFGTKKKPKCDAQNHCNKYGKQVIAHKKPECKKKMQPNTQITQHISKHCAKCQNKTCQKIATLILRLKSPQKHQQHKEKTQNQKTKRMRVHNHAIYKQNRINMQAKALANLAKDVWQQKN